MALPEEGHWHDYDYGVGESVDHKEVHLVFRTSAQTMTIALDPDGALLLAEALAAKARQLKTRLTVIT